MRTMLSHRAAHYAYDISKSKQSNLYIADEIEARLLAQQPYKMIAERTCYSEDALRLYESWFFNIHDRLTSPSYITHTIFGKAYIDG